MSRTLFLRGISRVALSTCASIALVGFSSAQTPPRVLGLSQNTPLLLSQDVSTCALAACPVGMPPPISVAPFVGGTAHDPRDRGTFVSNGLLIAKLDPRSTACAPLCVAQPIPTITPANPVTGLAFNETTSTLFATDASNFIRRFSVVGGCNPVFVNLCLPLLSPAELLTGCATDDLNGLIFYSSVIPGTVGGTVYVAPQSNPCNILCAHFIANCGPLVMGPLVGLGFDACAGVLWATDGRVVVGHSFNSILCTLGPQVQCCQNTSGDPYAGLCVLPSTETSAGPSCTAIPCPNCPTMRHTLSGDPTIGNPAFSLNLLNAPGATPAWLFLNVGPCAGPGVFSPPLCTPILVPFAPPWLMNGPFGTGGAAGSCNGNVLLNIAIPLNPLLCGIPLSTQWVGYCGAGGFYVSNCLSWMIGAT